MNATLVTKQTTNRFNFTVEMDGHTYDTVIWVDEKGKFADDEINLNGVELESEGIEGEIREKIIDYLDENWDSLTS